MSFREAVSIRGLLCVPSSLKGMSSLKTASRWLCAPRVDRICPVVTRLKPRDHGARPRHEALQHAVHLLGHPGHRPGSRAIPAEIHAVPRNLSKRRVGLKVRHGYRRAVTDRRCTLLAIGNHIQTGGGCIPETSARRRPRGHRPGSAPQETPCRSGRASLVPSCALKARSCCGSAHTI